MLDWNRKVRRRLLTVAQYSATHLLQPILNIAVSFLVIQQTSEELWGEFVAILVVVHFGIHISGWGNREHLLRDFSLHPEYLRELWYTSLSNRLIIALIIGLFLLILTFQNQPWIILWIVAATVAQSFDVLIIYRRRFLLMLGVDGTITLLSLVCIWTLGVDLQVGDLVSIFALMQSIRAIAFGCAFRGVLATAKPHISIHYLRDGFPFFVLGFSGMLASRIDLYAVSALQEASDVGRYQVFINVMLYLQALSAFITLPFVKTVYRMPDGSIFKLSRLMFAVGLLLTPIGLIAAYGVFTYLYDLQFSFVFILLGGAFVLPIYGFIPLIHRLYGQDKTTTVLAVNLIGAVLNFLLNMLLLPEIGLIGAILASAFVQWAMFIFYVCHAILDAKTGIHTSHTASTRHKHVAGQQ